MEPLSDSAFKKIFAVGVVLVVVCVAVMVSDESSLEYTSDYLDNYEPTVNDEIEYYVLVDGSEYYVEYTIMRIFPDVVDVYYELEDSNDSIIETGYLEISKAWITGDISVLAEGLTEKRFSHRNHTTDNESAKFVTLSCEKYRFRDRNITFTDIWPEGLGGHSNTYTGNLSLEIWLYGDNLIEYNLTMKKDGETIHSLSIVLIGIEGAYHSD